MTHTPQMHTIQPKLQACHATAKTPPAIRWRLIGKFFMFGAAILVAYSAGVMHGRSESTQHVFQTSESYEIRQAVSRYVARKALDVGEPTMLSERSALVAVRRNGDPSDTGCEFLTSKLPVPGSETLGVWIVSVDNCRNRGMKTE